MQVARRLGGLFTGEKGCESATFLVVMYYFGVVSAMTLSKCRCKFIHSRIWTFPRKYFNCICFECICLHKF